MHCRRVRGLSTLVSQRDSSLLYTRYTMRSSERSPSHSTASRFSSHSGMSLTSSDTKELLALVSVSTMSTASCSHVVCTQLRVRYPLPLPRTVITQLQAFTRMSTRDSEPVCRFHPSATVIRTLSLVGRLRAVGIGASEPAKPNVSLKVTPLRHVDDLALQRILRDLTCHISDGEYRVLIKIGG